MKHDTGEQDPGSGGGRGTDRRLTLADIADLRAYEREREAFRDSP